MTAYYNEHNEFAARWLRTLIAEGHIPAGDVDQRDIQDVGADDLVGYEQCHFFAGIGGWGLALRAAGWPDTREVWTGSCPCQPFSAVGQRRGTADERHLWPQWRDLIAQRRPSTVFGEQVARGGGLEWFAGVRDDLEAQGYAVGSADLPACSVAAPQKRERIWFVAVGDTEGERRGEGQRAEQGPPGRRPTTGLPAWTSAAVVGADGKRRRAEPGVFALGHGIPNRVEQLRGYGNAIVPAVAALFVACHMRANAEVTGPAGPHRSNR
jgi:DNA (cytosine-5)-methyltransferase 1